MSSPYYNPKKFGLTIVHDEDLIGGYEWDLCIVWKGGDAFYYGFDSGCSCSSPFEGIKGVDELQRLDLNDRMSQNKFRDDYAAWKYSRERTQQNFAGLELFNKLRREHAVLEPEVAKEPVPSKTVSWRL